MLYLKINYFLVLVVRMSNGVPSVFIFDVFLQVTKMAIADCLEVHH